MEDTMVCYATHLYRVIESSCQINRTNPLRKHCNLIGYTTRYLFVNRYRVAFRKLRDNAEFFKKNKKNNAYSLFFEIIVTK